MRRFPYWLKGGLLGISYIGVIVFLKGICQPEWCFADIFMPLMLEPLLILDLFFSEGQVIWMGKHFLATIFIFWFIFGGILGLIYGILKKNSREKAKS